VLQQDRQRARGRTHQSTWCWHAKTRPTQALAPGYHDNPAAHLPTAHALAVPAGTEPTL